jgi:hypothetical protein
LVYSHEGKGYLCDVQSGEAERILSDQPQLHAPTWWRDPQSGKDHITFMDRNDKHWYQRGQTPPGATFLYALGESQVDKIADFPCDGGLSDSGKFLAEAYGGCLLVDLENGEYISLNNGKQACNASLRPGNILQVMHLFLPHSHFGIRDRYDRVLWEMEQPEGSGEWQTPRWSTHANFCMATAKYGKEYKLVVINIATRNLVVLKSIPGSFRAPHLWLPPSKMDVVDENQPTLQERRKLFMKAKSLPAEEALPIYREIAAAYEGQEFGRLARARMTAPTFLRELAAENMVAEIQNRVANLKPPREGEAIYNNPEFFNRNQAALVQLIGMVGALERDYMHTGARERVAKHLEKYQLPKVAEVGENVELEVEATITAVSSVPTYEQIVPYTAVLTWIEYRVDRLIKGELTDEKIMVVHWGMQDTKHTAAATWMPGLRQKLNLDLFDAHPELARITRAQEAFEDVLLNEYLAQKVTILPENP